MEFTDKKKIEEFAHLAAAALLSIAGVQVIPPENERYKEVKGMVKAQS